MTTPEASNIRVVTTIGHVDHGKTTLMDALLAANNIISSRMAGKIRYMDSREDEQERGITMESSAVSLRFNVIDRSAEGGSSPRTYFVNIIDTPGHVDFSSEVSTASRLVDGALVLVDVVEGVSSQTVSVLRQAWIDRLRPILVINKLDRLVTELRQTPMEAYHHLSQLIEQANAVMGSFFAGERMEDDLRWREERERRLASKKDAVAEQAEAILNDEAADDFQEKDDEDIYFAPEKGNVVFASALGGWGFRIAKFAQIFAVRLGIKETNFRRVLWGDFYLDPKTKRVISHKHLRGRSLKPLFVQFVLENVWAVYDAILLNPNPDKANKIVSTLNLKIPPRDLNSKDGNNLLSLIFTQWLPLSTTIVQTIIDIIPSPRAAQPTRIPIMLHPDLFESHVDPKSKLEKDLYSCDAGESAHIVAYVSKMFAVPTAQLPEHKKQVLTIDEIRARAREARIRAEESREQSRTGSPSPAPGHTPSEATIDESESQGDQKEATETLLGFARLYCGVIRTGSTVACVLPKYNNALEPTHPRNKAYVVNATVDALYTMMGRDLVPVNSVSAGNIFAIRGLEGSVWRSATICAPSTAGIKGVHAPGWMINLGGVNRQAPPIVRVALEPVIPADMPRLIRGMKLLNQADPCVETFQQTNGEHVIVTAGELHLERCLKDLRERFAKVEIQPSEPIVPFRETAVKASDMAPPKTPGASRGTIHGTSFQNFVTFAIRAVPLPDLIADFLRSNLIIIKRLLADWSRLDSGTSEKVDDEAEKAATTGDILRVPTVHPNQFWDAFQAKCGEAGPEWAGIVDNIWAFGPQGAGDCLLIDTRKDQERQSLKRRLDRAKETESGDLQRVTREFDVDIETGFQIATFHGPLCAEPMEGMAFFVERVTIDKEGIEKENDQNRLSQITGSLISAVKEGCRNGLLDWSPRLKLAMYSCDIQASADVLGRVHGVVAKRRGRIIAEEMKEGTSFFTVSALLPVVESFGFADGAWPIYFSGTNVD
ncbi:P-loop containing nucleoside triphosphate hydrolase protein [Multifurca ochricompacta]|uniref:P-loop containing nucleoside triphosphate hydrolase protein n=1 Tax=Multifurca ochricompacta TaxID=376703 RepID=A0AAD4M8G2_9AGAM|nr:P-loop containing nucleoside triphosphate hydrolase protein [Multifurca ochricompacta]